MKELFNGFIFRILPISQKTQWSPEVRKHSNCLRSETQPVKGLKYLEINILINLAANQGVSITKTSNNLQNRQRLSFIEKVNRCSLSYGMKQKSMEYISHLESKSTEILPTVYEPPIDIVFTSASVLTSLDLPEAETRYYSDFSDTSLNVNIHITMVITPTLQQTCVAAINDQQPLTEVLTKASDDHYCYNAAVTILKQYTATPTDNYQANQIITIMMSSNSNQHSQPNFNLINTVERCSTLANDIVIDLGNVVTTSGLIVEAITRTTNKMIKIKLFCDAQKVFLSQHRSSSTTLDPTAILHNDTIQQDSLLTIDDLLIIQEFTNLQVQFCIRDTCHAFDRYTLLATIDNEFCTKQQIAAKLVLPIICCCQSNNSNPVGLMSVCPKITINKLTLDLAFNSVNLQIKKRIAKLPALNPTMRIQHKAANELALQLSRSIEVKETYSHICIHGIPNAMFENRVQLTAEFGRLNDKNPGIGIKLGISNANRYGPMIACAKVGFFIHKELVITDPNPYYTDGNQIIVIKLFQDFTTEIPWRTTMMELPDSNDKLCNYLLAATFITESIASTIISKQEIAAIRPLPQDYASSACTTILHNLQPKTSHKLHVIIMSANSKVQLQNKKVLRYNEIVGVLITPSMLDELATSDLRRNLKIGKSSDLTVQPVSGMRFQASNTIRAMSFLPYPDTMTKSGDHRYITFRKFKDNIKASDIIQHIQTHLPHISHQFVLVFSALLFDKYFSMVIITDYRANILELVNEFRTMVITHHISTDEYPHIETTSTLPGYCSNNILLNNKSKSVVHRHPGISSSWSPVTSKAEKKSNHNNKKLPPSAKPSPSSISSQSTLTSFYSSRTVPPAPPPSNNN